MRHLIILRGPRGSGRRQFAVAENICPWLIDQSELEPLFGDIVTDRHGSAGLDGQGRARARRRILELLAEKASRGNLIVFQPSDTGVPCRKGEPAVSDKMISSVVELVQKWRYQVTIIDFTEQYSAPELMKRRGRSFAGANADTEDRIDRLLRHMRRRVGLPRQVRILPVRSLTQPILDLLEPDDIVLDRYEHIVAIGDIHGCRQTFRSLLGNVGVRPDVAYIFLGDYINKGPDSGGVIRDLSRNFLPRENCFLLTGNHERPLEDWSLGQEPAKKVFTQTTLPSLAKHGIGPSEAAAFLSRTMDAARFRWRGLRILATHGGFSTPPERLLPLSAEHLRYGQESPLFDIDRAWEENVLCGRNPDSRQVIQVHGHRNAPGHPVAAGVGSFNLENGAGQGGEMRAVVFSAAPKGHITRALTVPCIDAVPAIPPKRNGDVASA